MKKAGTLAAARRLGNEMTEKLLIDPKCKLIPLKACSAMRGLAMAIMGEKFNLRQKWWVNKYIVVKVKGELMLPHWQSEPSVEPYLPKIIKILRSKGINDLGMLIFFMNGNTRLNGQSPLNALRKNKSKEVIAAARQYHEHGCD